MWPRIAIAIYPTSGHDGWYVAKLRKGWWGGPGKGTTSHELLALTVSCKGTDERERLRELLRGLADAL